MYLYLALKRDELIGLVGHLKCEPTRVHEKKISLKKESVERLEKT